MDERATDTVRATYRRLLLGGLALAEAANVTAYLHGLPSAGIRWTIAEVEAIVRRRAEHVQSAEVTLDDVALAAPLPWNAS